MLHCHYIVLRVFAAISIFPSPAKLVNYAFSAIQSERVDLVPSHDGAWFVIEKGGDTHSHPDALA
jgi:hypothetical protein